MLHVLYEDNHCIAVLKPARVLTAGDQTGDVSLLDMVRDYLKEKYQKPGKVFVGVVHRLDRPVSGVVVYARTSKSAGRLSEQFRAGTVHKVYRTIVEGNVPGAAGEFEDWLLKDAATNIVSCVTAGTRSARESRLRFRRLKTSLGLTLLEVTPETGRSHQIRVQLAARGHPIYGDRKYGSKHAWRGTIALHAAELTFDHPTRHEPVTVAAAAPAGWRALMSSLCGDE